jgi:hypothetical protein
LFLQDLSATIEIKNGNGATMVITVNGDSKIVNDGEAATWRISWQSANINESHTVGISATYEGGVPAGIHTDTFVVYNGDNKSLIITSAHIVG